MEKFTKHTGIGVPLRQSNVDTDQIIPAVYLKRVTRTGFEDGLFAAWRGDPEFVLNNEAYAAGSVLVAGPDFGTGSSREHAVWALQNYGFAAVLSPRFGDIFRGNAGKSGLVAAQVDEKVVQRLWDLLESEPGATVTDAPGSFSRYFQSSSTSSCETCAVRRPCLPLLPRKMSANREESTA